MSASFKLNDTEIFSELNQVVTAKNINVAANDTTTPSMAKAWVNFDGTASGTNGTFALGDGIRASYNVTSVLDNSNTGDFTINFTNSMSDANYSCVGSLLASRTIFGISSLDPSFVRIRTYDESVGFYDSNIICVSIFR